jgi:hypothetical protein
MSKSNAEVLCELASRLADNEEVNDPMELDHWLDHLAQMGVPGASAMWFKRLDEEIAQDKAGG